MREKKAALQWIAAMLVVAGLAISGQAQQKLRVAVVDFNDKEVRGEVRKELKKDFNIGRHVADLLITRLVEGSVYSIIERNDEVFKLILKEQDMGETKRMDTSTTAKVGKMLGTDIYVIGKITQYGKDKKPFWRKPIPGVFNSEKALVGLSYKIVDANTGEIIQGGEVKGEAKGEKINPDKINTDKQILGTKNPAADAEAEEAFAKTIFGEATYDAVGQLAVLLEKKAIERKGPVVASEEKPPPAPVNETVPVQKSIDKPGDVGNSEPAPKVETRANTPQSPGGKIGIVAAVSGLNIHIKLEQFDRVRVGDRIRIRRVKKEIKDPDDPQKVLDYEYLDLGLAQVSEIREKVLVAKFLGRAITLIMIKDGVFLMP